MQFSIARFNDCGRQALVFCLYVQAHLPVCSDRKKSARPCAELGPCSKQERKLAYNNFANVCQIKGAPKVKTEKQHK